jgi:hypothetical protein
MRLGGVRNSMTSVLFIIAMACSPDSAPQVTQRKPVKNSPLVQSKSTIRAVAGEMKVTVSSGTHSVGDPMLVWTDHNVYPADNAVVLQGVAQGPIGDHKSASVWLTGVHDHALDNGPSHLEAVVIYDVDCDDCPGDETTTAKIESRKSTAEKPASLMEVESMGVKDVDDDGQFEVIVNARFRRCCDGDDDRRPYSEQIVLKVTGKEIVAFTPQKSASTE